MSKITFRADDDLIRRLEEFDASKSEVMRQALRAYLDDAESDTVVSDAGTSDADRGSIDDALTERVDELIAERLSDHLSTYTAQSPQDVNVNISLDGVSAETAEYEATRNTDADARKTQDVHADETPQTGRKTCNQCGENIGGEHVYCPNCGEKASHRVFCECGDELRSDWAFCPSCGRRTPAADVLDRP